MAISRDLQISSGVEDIGEQKEGAMFGASSWLLRIPSQAMPWIVGTRHADAAVAVSPQTRLCSWLMVAARRSRIYFAKRAN